MARVKIWALSDYKFTNYSYLSEATVVKMATVVEGDQTAPFSIATTLSFDTHTHTYICVYTHTHIRI